MAAGNLFANAASQAFQGKINLLSDTLKIALLTSSASPNLATWVHFSDVTNEVTGTGYTAGGLALTSPSLTVTAANSWGTSAATSTGYTVGQVVRPATGNGYLYRCVVAGTSGGTAPTWPTVVGQNVTDGTVTWVNAGESITVFTTATPSWPSSTISAAYAVIYDSQSGTASTDPLILLDTFGSTIASSGSTFTVPMDPVLGWFSFTPA